MYSRSFKEYLADIDVCMGGRVAEELGTYNRLPSAPSTDLLQHMVLRMLLAELRLISIKRQISLVPW